MILTLASASPRRKELLKRIASLNVRAVPSNIQEHSYGIRSASVLSMALSYQKAADVFCRQGGTVLGSDTVVTMGQEIFGKPASKEEAMSMFRTLCGKTHRVITGVCIINRLKVVNTYQQSTVSFDGIERHLDRINAYIDSGKSYDKAGGYGIQDNQLQPLILHVDGSRDTIIGLPVKTVENILEEHFGWQRGTSQ